MTFAILGNEVSSIRGPRAKISPGLLRGPGCQTIGWVPSIPSVAWQPYPSPLGRLRAHSFASPPRDGFAFIENSRLTVSCGTHLATRILRRTCVRRLRFAPLTLVLWNEFSDYANRAGVFFGIFGGITRSFMWISDRSPSGAIGPADRTPIPGSCAAVAACRRARASPHF